jgi:hypothetical protein
MRRYDRRRRCGNVGIRRFWPDFQARWKGWKTRSLSFPRFPRGVISTAIFSSSAPLRDIGREDRPRLRRPVWRVGRRAGNLFSQEVKP